MEQHLQESNPNSLPPLEPPENTCNFPVSSNEATSNSTKEGTTNPPSSTLSIEQFLTDDDILPTYKEVIRECKEERRLRKEKEKILAHVVTCSDSWLSIAFQYGIKVNAIKEANRMKTKDPSSRKLIYIPNPLVPDRFFESDAELKEALTHLFSQRSKCTVDYEIDYYLKKGNYNIEMCLRLYQQDQVRKEFDPDLVIVKPPRKPFITAESINHFKKLITERLLCPEMIAKQQPANEATVSGEVGQHQTEPPPPAFEQCLLDDRIRTERQGRATTHSDYDPNEVREPSPGRMDDVGYRLHSHPHSQSSSSCHNPTNYGTHSAGVGTSFMMMEFIGAAAASGHGHGHCGGGHGGM